MTCFNDGSSKFLPIANVYTNTFNSYCLWKIDEEKEENEVIS